MFGGSVRTVSVRLAAEIAGYVTNMRQAGQATKAFSGELQTLSETSKAKFNDVTRFGLVAGAALVGFAAAAVAMAAKFDKEMSNVAAASGATGKALADLRTAAIVAGRDTAFSASQAATAEAELAKAGISVSDILGGALKGSLALAAAGQIDLGDAATYSAKAMNEFGLKGSAVPHIADVLAAAANNSATDVKGMADSLNQVGLVANQTGLTLEDTAGTLALFAQNGLAGSDAGTSFKTMLQALQAPSERTAGLMQELGINAYNAQGGFIGITNLAQQLKDKLGPLTQAQRDNALAQIFGSDAVRAAGVLYKEGAAGLEEWISGVNKSGAATDTARIKMDNLSGDIERLKGSVETLAITSGTGANGGLRQLAQAADGLVNAFADIPGPIQTAIVDIAGISGVTLLLGTGFVKAKGALGELTSTLSDMGPAGEKAATGLGKAGSVLGKAGLWGAGALLAYEGIKALADVIDNRTDPIVHDVDALTDSFARFAETGKVTGEFAKTFGEDLSGIGKDIATITAAEKELGQIRTVATRTDYTSKVVSRYAPIAENRVKAGETNALGDFSASDAALTNLVNNGQALAARSNFDAFRVEAVAAGKGLDWVYAQFPKYLDASNGLARQNGTTAASLMHVSTSAASVSIGMDEAIASGSKLADVLNSLSGANEDYGKSNIAAEQALADLNKQLKENDKNKVKDRKSLVDTTQAGRDNLKMILATIDTDKQQFQTMYAKKLQTEDSTAALKDATAQYDAYIGRLRTSLINEGFNATQVDALLKLYGAIPPIVSTTVEAPGLVEANDTASGYKRLMDQMDGRVVATDFVTKFQTKGTPPPNYFHGNRWGGAYEHAAVGLLSQASMYSTASPGRYMIAEPETGGEGFVPRYGNYARSTSIIDQEARWYGGRFVPNTSNGSSGGGGSSYSPSVTYAIYPQQANFSTMDLQAIQARHDAHLRVGRRH